MGGCGETAKVAMAKDGRLTPLVSFLSASDFRISWLEISHYKVGPTMPRKRGQWRSDVLMPMYVTTAIKLLAPSL